jgi:hypothetical protein
LAARQIVARLRIVVLDCFPGCGVLDVLGLDFGGHFCWPFIASWRWNIANAPPVETA